MLNFLWRLSRAHDYKHLALIQHILRISHERVANADAYNYIWAMPEYIDFTTEL